MTVAAPDLLAIDRTPVVTVEDLEIELLEAAAVLAVLHVDVPFVVERRMRNRRPPGSSSHFRRATFSSLRVWSATRGISSYLHFRLHELGRRMNYKLMRLKVLMRPP